MGRHRRIGWQNSCVGSRDWRDGAGARLLLLSVGRLRGTSATFQSVSPDATRAGPALARSFSFTKPAMQTRARASRYASPLPEEAF